jgi:hypothetical protein
LDKLPDNYDGTTLVLSDPDHVNQLSSQNILGHVDQLIGPG